MSSNIYDLPRMPEEIYPIRHSNEAMINRLPLHSINTEFIACSVMLFNKVLGFTPDEAYRKTIEALLMSETDELLPS